MGCLYAKDVIGIAQDWIGYHEGDNNWTIFAKILDDCFYFDPQYKQNVAWCATFCDFCCVVAALPADRSNDEKKYDAQFFLYQPSKNNYSCSAREFANYFKNVGAWYTSDPMPGDMIFFDYGSGIAHVGIVEDVDGCITSIEGNAGDMVQRKWYDFDEIGGRIAGFGRPRYDGYEPNPKPDPEPTPTPTPEPQQKFTVQTYSGDALRLRAEPNTSSEQVGWIDNGTTFVADDIVEGEYIGGINTWVYYNGGYASGRYLYPTPEIVEPEPIPEPDPIPEPTPDPTPEPIPEPSVGEEYTVRVNTFLAVRSTPEALEDDSNKIGELYNGAIVIVYAKEGNWAKIGGNMWVSMTYLED